MATSVSRVDPISGLNEPRSASSRIDYQRAACQLPLAWDRIKRAHPYLRSDDLEGMMWLLGRIPGQLVRLADRPELLRQGEQLDPKREIAMATALGWSRGKALRCEHRLRRSQLLIGVTYRKRRADRVDFGRRNFPKTNRLRMYVNVNLVDRFARDPSDGSTGDPSTGSDPRELGAATPKPPSSARAARRTRKDDTTASPSPGDSRSVVGAAGDSAPASLRAPTPRREREHGGDEEQAAGQADASSDAESALLDELCDAWNAQAIPEAGGTVSRCRKSERTAIRNQLRRFGAAVLRLAIAGAGADAWLRRDLRTSAVAWVFRRDGSGVEHYAAAGAELQRVELAEQERKRAKREAQRAADAEYQRGLRVAQERAIAWRKAQALGVTEDDFAIAWRAELQAQGAAPAVDVAPLVVRAREDLARPPPARARSSEPTRIGIPLARGVAGMMRQGADQLDTAADDAERLGASLELALPQLEPGELDPANDWWQEK